MPYQRHSSQRSWQRPPGAWMMAQTWQDVLFAHWPVPLEALRVAIPAPLEVDTYEGTAWLGIVALRATGVRPNGLPPLPFISSFPGLNLRTYVRLGKRPGLWFLSLDTGGLLAAKLGRKLFHLPYFRARMKVRRRKDGIHFECHRADVTAPPAEFCARYRPVGHTSHSRPGSLEHWLTERYCAYSVNEKEVFRTEIHHRHWPLQQVEADCDVDTMAEAQELALPDIPPLLHYSRSMKVEIWPPRAVAPAG